ncbi:hypothetical protein Tco_1355524, partial [Tanacetum coccineum]
VNAILEKDENGSGLFVDIRELKSVAVKECSFRKDLTLKPVDIVATTG